jgi:hypothetical protein
MKTCIRLAALLSLLISLSLAHSQDREAPVDKILNPLPQFDPFEKPPEPPQYFPDAVDKRAREVLIDALTQNNESLEDHLQFFKGRDVQLQKQQGTATGLTEDIQDLINNTIRDRERYLAAQKEALKNAGAPERKKYLDSIIKNDDLNQADQLLRQGATNYWGGTLNRLLGSVDLVGVASGNYIGAAAETVISQLYALADRDISVEERRALVRHLDHLKRFPDDPHNTEIRKKVEKLDQQKRNALVRKQLDKVDEATSKGEIDKAMFFSQLAAIIDPQSRQAEKSLQNVTRLYNEQEEGRKKVLAASEERAAPAEQHQDIQRLLEALSLRDANQTERLAANMETKYRGTALADAALDAQAVALEMKGWHDAARKGVADVARSAATSDAKKRATALLQSPEYNLFAMFNDARFERRLQSMKYVVLGEDLLKKNLLYAAGAMAAAGPAGAATLGTVNALLMGTNLVQVLTNNPISSQPVIDAGVAYIRNHPKSEDASEVYKVLAGVYEERGLFDKAISYHELAGTAEDKVAALKEKAAERLVDVAGKTNDRSAREYYLTSVIDQYPESPAAAEATKKLAQLARDENRGLRISKQFLMENPELYGPRGLGLKSSLFDGNTANMELADRGVNFIGDNEVLVYYETPWGVRSQSYTLSKPAAQRFFVTLREKNHEVAMADVNQRAKGSVGGIKNLPPPIVDGEREKPVEKPEDRNDTTFTLIREAAGRSYPKVLDHQLLSENERDPGSKYKIPPIQGSISASRFSMSGALPAGLWGNQLAVGTDPKGTFAGVQLPIPLLQSFVPVDFMVQGRPGGFSVYPKIHMDQSSGEDPELYR